MGREAVREFASESTSVGDLIRRRFAASPEGPAVLTKQEGAWETWTWAELETRVRAAARGMVELGVEVGDRVAILGPTRPPWVIYDMAGHLIGAVTLGLYPKQSAEQYRHLLIDSGAKLVLVSGADEWETVLASAEGLETVAALVPWEEELAEAGEDDRIHPPSKLQGERLGDQEIERRLAEVRREDLAILVYTSGTTGAPKGAMISHGNLLTQLEARPEIVDYYSDDRLFAFLPMAHVSQRVLLYYMRLNAGLPAAYASSISTVLQELGEARPTIFGSVPRLYEKAYAQVQNKLESASGPARALAGWALGVGKKRGALLRRGEAVPAWLALRYRLAERILFDKVRQAFGGRIRLLIVGAAPTAREILEFFWAAGMPIYEVYGMTEATCATHCNREGATKLGTVGQVIAPLEHRLAEDGEILLRGPFVFQGYFNNPEATAEALQDGWLHTGDVGEIDDDGFLRITDRKKHLIITAGGKNIAPALVEQAIKNEDLRISQIHVHGDRRAFLTALVAPSPIETLTWGVENGMLEAELVQELVRELTVDPSARSERLNQAMAQVVERPGFQQLFVEPIRRGNRKVARVERVRRFALLERDFSQEGGELTPTLKVKRKEVERLYADRFDRLYADPSYGLDSEPAERAGEPAS